MVAECSEARALAAACAVATEHGVCCEQATVAHSGSNVLVHLRPAPVVARVMTGTVVLHDDPQRWLEREVSVLSHLAPSGLAVRPSSLIAPGPYSQDGLWLTFWEWLADQRRAELDHGAEKLGSALRELHEALSNHAGELGDLLDLRHDIERLHRKLRPTDALGSQTIDALQRRLLALTPSVFAAPLPGQALHGDVSLSNLLSTPTRLVWNDFEDTLRGPLHWDVASYVVSLRSRGADSTFIAQVLEVYGWDDQRELEPFIEAHALYGEIWQLYRAGRRAGPCRH